MKVLREKHDIYSSNVTVTMSEAEWEFIMGLALHASAADRLDVGRRWAANRLLGPASRYHALDIDFDRLFTKLEEE